MWSYPNLRATHTVWGDTGIDGGMHNIRVMRNMMVNFASHPSCNQPAIGAGLLEPEPADDLPPEDPRSILRSLLTAANRVATGQTTINKD